MKHADNRGGLASAGLPAAALFLGFFLGFVPAQAQAYTEAFKLDLSDPAIRAKIEAQGGAVVPEGPDKSLCIRIAVPAGADGAPAAPRKTVEIPVDAASLRGAKIGLTGLVRGEAISEPSHAFNGVKVQLCTESPTKGRSWIDQQDRTARGTFDWKRVGAMGVVAADAAKTTVNLGLQESSGTVWLTDVRVERLRAPGSRPAPTADDALVQKTTQYRGVMSPGEFHEQDFKDLKAWGANLVRWQLGGGKDKLAAYDTWLDAKLDELELALRAAQANGIKLVIDLHLPPFGREADGTLKIALDRKAQDVFVANWEKIARRFKGNPAVYGYDLVNEPVQNQLSPEGVDDWLGVQVRAAKAVRAIDPSTPILIETDEWDSPEPFALLQPVDVPNVIYQVHMYWPGTFTHQGVHTNQGIAKDKDSKPSEIRYPGTIAGMEVDKEALRAYLAPVRAFQKAYNVRIYVGEFSAVRWAPGAARYLDDLISIFEEYGWDWTYHAFREWGGWSVESANLPYDRQNHPKASEPTDRQLVLMKWLALNKGAAK